MESSDEFSYNYPSSSDDRPYVSNEAGQAGLLDGLRNVLVYEKPEHPIPIGAKNCISGHDFEWEIRQEK